MKRVRSSIAAIAASALLATSGADAALHRTISISDKDPSGARAFALDAPTTATPLDALVRAAEAGNVDAMNLLGVLYTLGANVPRDYSKALYWYKKAIDGGSTEAALRRPTRRQRPRAGRESARRQHLRPPRI